MEEQITHLVVNWINIDDNVILVGATDNLSWKWDVELGNSGVDAKTIVCVTLTENGKGYAVSEEAVFHSSPEDPARVVAMSFLIELFDIAWFIKNENLSYIVAQEKYFGKEIKNHQNVMKFSKLKTIKKI